MKISLISSIFLISVLVLIPDRNIISCSFSPDPDAYGYNFFNQEVIGDDYYLPILFTWHSFYRGTYSVTNDALIEEWRSYFKNIPAYDDVKNVVYSIPVNNLIKCSELLNNSGGLPDSLSANSCMNYIYKTKDKDFLTYMLYARRCEPNVNWTGEWSTPEYNLDSLEILKKIGDDLYNSTSNSFMKLKYAFQMVRLAHYANNADECIRLYDQLIEPMKEKSFTRWRALAHKAGSYYMKDDALSATYFFVEVFKNCPALRTEATIGFDIEDESQFQDILGRCRDDQMKAALYAIRAIQPYSKALEDMKTIYQIDPTIDYNDLLLVREVKMLENVYLRAKIYNYGEYWEYDYDLNPEETLFTYDSNYLREFRSFINIVIKENKIRKPALWKLASGYLAVYDADFAFSEKCISDLKNMNVTDNNILKSMKLLQIGMDIRKLHTLDETENERIFQEFQDLTIFEHNFTPALLKEINLTDYLNPDPDIYSSYPNNQFRYFLDVLSLIYKKNGNQLKVYLCNSDFESLRMDPNLDLVNGLLDLIDKKGKLPFETYLSTKAGCKNELLEVKGTLLLQADNQKEAIKVFKSIPAEFLQKNFRFYINADPFAGNLNDCLSCDDSIMEKSDFVFLHCLTKLQFAEKILSLKKKANGKGEKAAEANYLLGNAFYNTTDFGSAWMAYAYWRPYGSGSFDCSKAQSYYEKAILLTKNIELAAKCCFMAAKCEHNSYYKREQKNSWDLIHIPDNYYDYQNFFKLLNEKYTETEYYKEVIKECSYFRQYLTLIK
jgi:hypothetical protein